MKGNPVLIVEAHPSVREELEAALLALGYGTVAAASVDEALATLAQQDFAFCLLDTRLVGSDGLDLLRRLRAQGNRELPVIMLADEQDLPRVAEATALGADDFLQKSFTPIDLENVVKETLARPRRRWEPASRDLDDAAARLRSEVDLWRSPRMREIWEILQQAARVDVTVLVVGETGTGKDLVARAIHQLSVRRQQPFVKVNCAAVPRELLESELFGHERGAFTGAHQLKVGKFETAKRGTIFLDEIAELHPALQAKLLHVLQDGTFSRVGGKATIKVDVRVLAATNRDLEHEVRELRFREDLYYRLNVIQITVPPLRERMEEVPRLAAYFVDRYAKLFQRQSFKLSPVALDRLMQHHYPGNVRELENLIKRMIVLDDGTLARMPFLRVAGDPRATPPSTDAPGGDPRGRSAPQEPVSLKDIARQAARGAEREAIARALKETGWNRVRAAKLLKISYRALLYKIKDAGLDGSGQPALPRSVGGRP